MHESERNRLLNEARRLVLARKDMAHAIAAAKAILRGDIGGDLERALETALIVCYARAFTKNGVGQLDEEWAPVEPDKRSLHDAIVKLRHGSYAHTDVKAGVREVIDLTEMFGGDAPQFAEEYAPLDLDHLPSIIELAEDQASRFREGVKALESQLQGR